MFLKDLSSSALLKLPGMMCLPMQNLFQEVIYNSVSLCVYLCVTQCQFLII